MQIFSVKEGYVQDKGLFTFYKEQEEFEKQLSKKVKAAQAKKSKQQFIEETIIRKNKKNKTELKRTSKESNAHSIPSKRYQQPDNQPKTKKNRIKRKSKVSLCQVMDQSNHPSNQISSTTFLATQLLKRKQNIDTLASLLFSPQKQKSTHHQKFVPFRQQTQSPPEESRQESQYQAYIHSEDNGVRKSKLNEAKGKGNGIKVGSQKENMQKMEQVSQYREMLVQNYEKQIFRAKDKNAAKKGTNMASVELKFKENSEHVQGQADAFMPKLEINAKSNFKKIRRIRRVSSVEGADQKYMRMLPFLCTKTKLQPYERSVNKYSKPPKHGYSMQTPYEHLLQLQLESQSKKSLEGKAQLEQLPRYLKKVKMQPEYSLVNLNNNQFNSIVAEWKQKQKEFMRLITETKK